MKKIEDGLMAVNKRDLAAFTRLLEPVFKLYLILKPERLMPQGQVSGVEGFAACLNMLYTAFPDVQFRQIRLTASGHLVYHEVVIHGTHNGRLTLPNGIRLPPTAIKIQLPTEVFHTFDEHGGFISSTGYANLVDIMKLFGPFGG